MADDDARSTSPSSTSGTATEGESAFWTWILPVMSFLVGVALAGFLFFLFFADDDDGSDELLPQRTPTPTPTADEEDQLVVRVPASCVEAAEAANTVASALGDVANAVRDLDAREVQRTLDTVQQLQPDVERVSQECLDIAADAEIITPSPSVSPTPSPSS
ncbi:MAG: hypothetical protein ACLGIG_02105 [Actinomycetes bacterium]